MERLAIFRGGWLTGGKFLLFLLFWISKSLILLRAAQAGDKEGNIIGSEVGDTLSSLPWLPRQPGAVLTRTGERATAAGYRYS